MNEIEKLVKNWLVRAENDLKIAKDEIGTENPATDTICFHAQQCVEKYLKAYLIFNQKRFRKTHNIAKLIELCKEFYFPTIDETEEAIEIAEKVKSFVLKKLKEEGFKNG